ncbi:lysine biosynthesis protein LysX [Halarchaeum nitratireducens]|uniref:Lysine biosynthesis enzyme LysX n=1 Tax=Halarchaeum nitratireducens TaxID=489913 RepID=A0A830G743_9EURY|nr:lysine biosynthesis protein LysX [Halarchaeum nitratireducens]GGN05456.1 lysine biosynthesis enzyme LysX [Halarchaeum nitratireducens]
MKVGLLYSRIRKDEKLLLGELRERGHDVEKVDVRKQQFGVGNPPEALAACDVVLDRCLATSRSKYATTFCESYGVPVVNDATTADVCADKAKTSVKLDAAGIPTPATTVAFDVDAAMDAIESYGYPCVIKPVVGSWGRLLAKIESESAAEAILEHKKTLGHYEHSVFYVQEFVEKPGRDLRVLTLDGEPVAAMARSSEHWLTNAAKGAEVTEYDIPEEVAELARDASDAVGGGLLGVDVMETGDGYTVPEVNHTVEFKALNDAVETDVPAAVVDWLETKADAAANAEVSA